MREIKFRAWIPELNAMSAVWSLSFSEWGKGNVDQVMTSLISPNNPVRKITDTILMQYTGLKDKNGKEIYEGDIFIIGKKKIFVAYEESNAMFALKEKHEYYDLTEAGMCEYSFSTLEIIGNIHEHPHLLTP